MPMLIPVVAAFATVAGGVAALGAATTLLGTIAAYATIAGGVLTGVGALTGSKDLMKIGAVLSIGGAIGTLASGVAGAAGAAAGEAGASAAIEAGGGTAADDAAIAAMEAGQNAGGAGALPGEALTPAGEAVTGATTGTLPTGQITTPGGGVDPGSLSGAYQNVTAPIETTTQVPGALDAAGDYGSLAGRGAAGTSETVTGPMAKIAEGAKEFNAGDVSSWFDRAKNVGGAVSQFIEKNPSLVKIGGDMIASMYGPNAEAMDFRKSIYERAQRNLNAPVALTYRKA